MKKHLLLICALATGLTGLAQESQTTGWKAPKVVSPDDYNAPVERKVEYFVGPNENNLNGTTVQRKTVPVTSNTPAPSTQIDETKIGETKYDLQTNSSIQRRLLNHGNGKLSAVWTYSNSDLFTTRGTGYNYYDGSSWGPQPTNEIETTRTGWPNILTNASGQEIVLAHDTQNDRIAKTQRNTIGSGTWSESDLGFMELEVWSRAAVGGPNGNTIHLIGLTLPTTIQGGNPGTPYNGIDGALLYNRSLNGGNTWDQFNVHLPFADSTKFLSFGGDSYSIDAKGNVVAIVQATIGTGVQMWKSTDNGTSWTHTYVVEPWFIPWDEASNMIPGNLADAMYGSDGTCHVLIDNNDQVHVWFGRQFITNDVTGDGNIGFFPQMNGIDYWNESFESAPPVTIAGAVDDDGDGVITISGGNNAVANYRFTGLSAYPSASIDSEGNMYMVYTAVKELLTDGVNNYRHVYGVRSSDGGCTWTEPLDLTGAAIHNFHECMYPSAARLADSKVHLTYQQDFQIGINLQGIQHAVTDNDMIYMTVDTNDLTGIGACATGVDTDTLLCVNLGSITATAIGCGTSYLWSTGATSQSITITQLGTYTVSTTTACGVIADEFNVVAPTGPPTVTISATQIQVCPGDTSTLTATTPVIGSSYLWSTGATTQSTQINNPGTYTVTVTDCGGSTPQTITITQPNTPPNVVIQGSATICPGATNTLTVQYVTGGSYLWSTGATTQSATISATGTYTVTVTNCGGTNTASFQVDPEPLPNAEITAPNGTQVCVGETVTLFASGGSNYSWSNNATGPSIVLTQVSESGNYSVTVTNDCGDQDIANISVEIFDNPAIPLISFANGTYSSSASSSLMHQWYLDGTAIPGATQTTYSGSVPQGAIITLIVTNDNGCSAESDPFTGISEVTGLGSSLNIFPNPNNGEFTVAFENANNGVYTLEIENIVGQIVSSERISVSGSHNHQIDLTSMESGVYFITVSNGDEETTQKIVVR